MRKLFPANFLVSRMRKFLCTGGCLPVRFVLGTWGPNLDSLQWLLWGLSQISFTRMNIVFSFEHHFLAHQICFKFFLTFEISLSLSLQRQDLLLVVKVLIWNLLRMIDRTSKIRESLSIFWVLRVKRAIFEQLDRLAWELFSMFILQYLLSPVGIWWQTLLNWVQSFTDLIQFVKRATFYWRTLTKRHRAKLGN